MNTKDTNNFDLIESYIKCFGFQKADEKYAISELRNPTLDDEYKNLVGADLRKIWTLTSIDATELHEKDEGWKLFQNFFRNIIIKCDIKYDDYKSNKKIFQKNTVKIKKILTDTYMADPTLFVRDYRNTLFNESLQNLGFNSQIKNDSGNKAIIEKYIIKAFEQIGTVKLPDSELKLVLSCNFADWMLCSAGETWTSCLNVGSGAYWRGIVSLIGDKNRAMLYITNGKKKNWHGIEVDAVLSRTWVLLSDMNEKKIIKFYPQSFLKEDDVKSITGDNSYTFNPSSMNGKSEIVPICFNKDGVWSSIYNDGCRIHKDKFHKTGKLFLDFSGGRSFDVVSIPHKTFEGIEIIPNSANLHNYLEYNKSLNDDIQTNHCKHCDKFLKVVHVIDNNFYCSECSDLLYSKCDLCGKYHEKRVVKSARINNDTVDICNDCFNKTVICKCCGERFTENETKTLKNKTIVCNTCKKTRVKVCYICGDEVLDINAIKHEGELVCSTCFKKPMFIKYEACDTCNSSILKTDMIYDMKGIGTCEKCLEKIVYDNKSQIHFDF